MLNYRTHAIVAGAVALWLSGAALAGTIASPVAVFPLHNATGETGLDWVAVGLQDSLTVDLWYISALHTKALPQFVEKIQNSCPDLALRCVTGQNLADWRRFAQARAYGGFLWGEYRREGAAWVLRLSWYDPGTEQPPTEQTVRRNSLPEVLAASSEALLALLASRDIAVSDAERNWVRAPKTPVLAAWEQNARGYWEQQRYGATDEAQRPTVRAAWERHLRAAVAADPAYAEAWNNLGWQRDTVESVADERVAHQCTPDAAPATPAPAVEPQTPSADGVFQRAVQYKPELIDALVGRGEALRRAKQPAEALTWYERAVALNPSLAHHRRLLLDTYLEAERPEAGLARLSVLDEHLRHLGREDERQALNDWRGRYHEALQQWVQALTVYEAWDAYLAQAGDAACRQCRLNLAVRLRVTGEKLAKQNQPQDAETYLRRALAIQEAVLGTELTATTRLTLKALAEIVEKREQTDEARTLRERAETDLAPSLAAKKQKLGGNALEGVTREWWQAFEEINAEQPITILALLEELEHRQASLEDFFQAYLQSGADSVPDILNYLDQHPAKNPPSTGTI